MGVTRFSGPVYGAKETLFSAGPVSASTGSSAVFAGIIVPVGEDWYVTELSMFRTSTGSTNFVVSVQDDSTTIGSVGVGASSIAAGAVTVFTADGGEHEGLRILTGSTVTLSHSSHAGPNANVCVAMRGFARWIASTRANP
jgi:hypothetical protein